MSAKNCPETPRQRMISLMYLVLMALLALNVDKSVLDAFETVDRGLSTTIENFNSKNARVYADFAKAALDNPEKSGNLNLEAKTVKAKTDSLYNYITELKKMLVVAADGEDGNIHNIKSKDNTQVAPELMLVKHQGRLGKELKQSIESYRKYLLSLVDPKDTALIASIKSSLNTSDPPPVEGNSPSWQESIFQGYPLVAVVTLMSKMQSDIRNTESDVANYLYSKIDATSFKFNKLKAQILPKTDYVLEGGTYEARIFLSAVDTTAEPQILVDGKKVPVLEGEGVGEYQVPATTEGTHHWKGFINYKGPSGQIRQYPFEGEYQVAKPSMTVSPTKMNVFYAGLANPVSISVPGIPANKVIPSITNATMKSNGRNYLVYPKKPGVKSVITVKAEIDGHVKTIGSTDFRVKRVPDPVATVGGKNEGQITKNELLLEQGVYAEIPDFDFDMKFTVTSFVVSTTRGGFVVDKKSNSNLFTPDQINLMKSLNSGSRLYIENIVAKGEDGTTRNLSAISFRIR
ncbi:gliding motility protein GldM [Prolixibacter sp. NT017]|uniref:type IX secretion system motor protein PorM/GldM n=1 Tax=Prolixibacter sp. NT017 TaxID=2652390 RepID=UPI001298FB84|nr:gliding motility protein GldM [Prolixibacter sp. NT017]